MTLIRFPSDRVTRPAGAAWAADADIRPATAAAPRRDAADFLDALILIPLSLGKFPVAGPALRLVCGPRRQRVVLVIGAAVFVSLVPKLDNSGAPPRNWREPCQDGRIRFVGHKLR